MAQTAPEQSERRPPQLQADCEAAREIMRAGGLLPARLWVAWMAQYTGQHTYGVVRNREGEIVGFAATLQFDRTVAEPGLDPPPEPPNWNRRVYAATPNGTALDYLRPSQIVRRLFALIGTPREVLDWECLRVAIFRLEDEAQRGFCLEACGMLDKHGQEVAAPAAIVRQISALENRVVAPLRVVSGGGGQQVAMALPPPMTEPREAFEAELAQLREGKNRRGQQASPVGAFFEEGGGGP